MIDDGYTWDDIAGELWARGIDTDALSSEAVCRAIREPTPEMCARQIEQEAKHD